MKHQDILDKMTLEEKASLLSGKNFWESMDYPEYGIPGMFLSDGPHGIRKQAAAADQLGLNPSLPATCFPTAASLANSWNIDLLKEVGTALGDEAVKLHVHMLLGPGINMKRNPRCGRSFEYFSEDPYLAGKLAANMIQGIQSNGISACVKHYAANNQEERRINSDSIIDERALRELYTTAFEIAVKEGQTKSIMTSYNMVNGYYTNENDHLCKDILRDEFGYQGLIVTDWGGENDRIAGLKATNELEMPGNNGDTDREIVRAVKKGDLEISYVDEACDRIIDLAQTTDKVFADWKNPVGEIDGVKVTGLNCYPEVKTAHHESAKHASDETIVLLKNEGNVLPLKKEDNVAVIGDFAQNPRYQGAGSSCVNCTQLDTFVEKKEKNEKEAVYAGTSLEKKFKFNYLGFAQGFDRYGKEDENLANEALELAKKADIVLYFMGLDEVTESEGLDRPDINLKPNQIALLKKIKALGKKVVVILSCGAVVDLAFESDCDALIHAQLSGQAGCNSILDIINGDVNPSGKLSETYPLTYDDVPTKNNFGCGTKSIRIFYKESIFIGYRYYQKADVAVRYPFGYGLSYTTFEYSDLKVTENGVTFTVKNTGAVAGKEVAQLYVGLKDSKIFRPVKELKGFHKTKLLEPGESEEITIPFDDKTFRFFNAKSMKWEIEGGTYDIYVGASSVDIKLNGTIAKESTVTELPYDASKLAKYYDGKIQDVSDEEFAALLGRELPDDGFKWLNDKHTRMEMTQCSLFCDLPYAKRWVGRLVGKVLRMLANSKNKSTSNMIVMGPYSFPMRAISRMLGMSMIQAEGVRMMFNGHFWKGLGQFLGGDKEAPKFNKENHYKDPKKEEKKEEAPKEEAK